MSLNCDDCKSYPSFQQHCKHQLYTPSLLLLKHTIKNAFSLLLWTLRRPILLVLNRFSAAHSGIKAQTNPYKDSCGFDSLLLSIFLWPEDVTAHTLPLSNFHLSLSTGCNLLFIVWTVNREGGKVIWAWDLTFMCQMVWCTMVCLSSWHFEASLSS